MTGKNMKIMLYLQDNYQIEMLNLITGEEKTVTAKKQ